MRAKPTAIAIAVLQVCGHRGLAPSVQVRSRGRLVAGGLCTVALPGLLLSAAVSAATHSVTANNNMTFTPSSLSIAAGDTVTFHNNGGLHNVRSDPGAVTSFRCANGCDGAGGNGDPSSSGWSATVKFPTAGTIRYFCEVHGGAGGIGMSGQIIVTGSAPPPSVATRCDFDGDRHSDVFWRNVATGADTIWRSANAQAGVALPAVDTSWTPVGVGDYNGDGHSDILWRNGPTGRNVIWRSANANTTQAVTGVSNTAWTVVGSGDYDGDKRADILWRNVSTGANAIWRAASSASSVALPAVATAWKVVGSGDYDGDGHADIFWRNGTTGANVLWRSGNANTAVTLTTVTNTAWTVVGSGDYDGDHHADVLWRNGSTGADVIWRSANARTPQSMPAVTVAWKVVGSGDYNGDGHADVLWRNRSSGANALWLSANPSTSVTLTTVADQRWSVVPSE